MKTYDYIVAGAGAAGLSLLMHMIRSGRFSEKKILLIDKDPKTTNDRTWCFWQTEPGIFEEVVFKRWNKLLVHGHDRSALLHHIDPYQYKLIRGIDFYNFCMREIGSQPNIEVARSFVHSMQSQEGRAIVRMDDRVVEAPLVFNSIIFEQPAASANVYLLKQHFKGWFIKTSIPAFDAGTATLMDFRTGQQDGTSFFYVMPFSATEALVEYTLFSGELLPDGKYDEALEEYCRQHLHLPKDRYEITSKERGSIPMTNYPFQQQCGNIFNIGTAGGQTKPSSGYTFNFIQKNSETIVKALASNDVSKVGRANPRFRFYDSVLLNILWGNKHAGAHIFTRLFARNDAKRIFRFLDEETLPVEDLKIISKLPIAPFFIAALSHVFRGVPKRKNLQNRKALKILS